MRWKAFFLLFVATVAPSQQPIISVPSEPVNIAEAKQKLKDYHECSSENCYFPQFDRQIDVAIRLMKASVEAKVSKPAIVLDIDETSLSNWAVELLDDFSYVPSDSNLCVKLRCGKAIPGTLRLFHEAQALKVTVFFITGRPENQRDDTKANLIAEGFDHWEQLYLRPIVHPPDQLVEVYKSSARQDILKQGYSIILNVGDQLSDLRGPAAAQHSIKLPNPFYYIP